MRDRTETIEFDVDARQYRSRFDPETTAPSVAVVDVARTVFEDDADRDPLYDAVDPAALDRFLEPHPRRDRNGSRSVSFRYLDALVTVDSDGLIAIDPDGEFDR